MMPAELSGLVTSANLSVRGSNNRVEEEYCETNCVIALPRGEPAPTARSTVCFACARTSPFADVPTARSSTV